MAETRRGVVIINENANGNNNKIMYTLMKTETKNNEN